MKCERMERRANWCVSHNAAQSSSDNIPSLPTYISTEQQINIQAETPSIHVTGNTIGADACNHLPAVHRCNSVAGMKLSQHRHWPNVQPQSLSTVHIIHFSNKYMFAVNTPDGQRVGHCVNPFKASGVKWLHFKVFRAILV